MKTLINSESNKSGFTLVELLIGIVIIGMILGGISQLLGHILSTYNAVQASQESVPEARYALERMVMFVQETDLIDTPATITPVERLTVSERVSDQYNNVSHAYVAAGDGFPDADTNKDGLIIPYELLTLDVAPGGAGWAAGDTLTGATSTKTCKIVEVLTTKAYTVKDRTGAFTLGEIISNGSATADQGAAYPTFTLAAESITFTLDKTDPNNWKLTEQMPDYITADTGDHKTPVVICEHIKPDSNNPPNNPLGFSCKRLLRPDGTLSGIVEIVLTLQKGSATVTLKTTAKSRWVE